MDVLAVTHGADAGPALFGQVVREQGHRLHAWTPADGVSGHGLDRYDAAFVFGGAMHPDQERLHPWLDDEVVFLRRLLEDRVPTLGVCLGAQLLAKAAGGRVRRASEAEIGWVPVELTDAAGDDPLFGTLPVRFDTFQWHEYTYDLPPEATELARSRVCSQAFRLDEAVWAIQFHAEITSREVERWLDEEPEIELSRDDLSGERMAGWNELGRSFCGRFLELAARVGSAA